MNLVATSLAGQLLLTAVTVLLAVVTRGKARAWLAGAGCTLLAATGALSGALTLAGQRGTLEIPTALPLGPVLLSPTPLGAVAVVEPLTTTCQLASP